MELNFLTLTFFIDIQKRLNIFPFMNKMAHNLYIGFFVAICSATLLWLVFFGSDYYTLNIEDRFFHESHETLKPSGILGHGMGIIGSFLILFGVFSYMARKRYRSLSKLGLLKHWLEFHIFLCVEGSILILFHTSFKFGGIVSISFWSMVAVVLSGVIGRFIYIQIPRTLEGRALSLQEVIGLKSDFASILEKNFSLDSDQTNSLSKLLINDEIQGSENNFTSFFVSYFQNIKQQFQIRSFLAGTKLQKHQKRELIKLVSKEINLNRKITWLNSMQKIFKYWHVAHLPFAIVMLIIMIIHVIITLFFGYKWIF
mgnify:CR=1 FL=1|jgi:hypothetical protein